MSLLAGTDLTRSFGGVRVLHGVDFDVAAGEVHALVGENGAGNSTLIKILGGALRADAGTVRLGGTVRPPAIRSAPPAPASAWCIRSSRSFPISASPTTCSSAASAGACSCGAR